MPVIGRTWTHHKLVPSKTHSASTAAPYFAAISPTSEMMESRTLALTNGSSGAAMVSPQR